MVALNRVIFVFTPPLRKVHKAGLRVLKATSALIRIQILGLLEERGPMSYTEIMNALKLNATRDAGRFAYHLKSLSKFGVAELNISYVEIHCWCIKPTSLHFSIAFCRFNFLH